MKKFISILVLVSMAAVILTGCGASEVRYPAAAGSENPNAAEDEADTGMKLTAWGNGTGRFITVVSREDGSGTRDAFVDLFGIRMEDAAGNKTDRTTREAVIVNSTGILLSNVAGDPSAIGYVSLGALRDTVKPVKINGVEITPENILNGSYEIARPFNIATGGEIREVTQDFIHYIMSAEGQAVIAEGGYVPVAGKPPAFESNMAGGKIVIAGSSSISPIMEKLIEAYLKINTDAEIDLQISDSTTGLRYVMDGTADIGMASRELKDSEASVSATVIAMDGIAVIVNPENPVEDMTREEVRAIFTGESTAW